MDFFGRQENLESKSRAFFIAFFMAVATAVVLLYFAVTACLGILSTDWPGRLLYRDTQTGNFISGVIQNLPTILYGSPPRVLARNSFLKVGGGILAMILLVSWYKTRRIKWGGGAYLAETLGGRLIEIPADFKEKQLLHVVEEMAVASGLPRPRVYVLPQERAINAVTAGLSHDDAVITVTAGALAYLTRDELQGVVAHEFAHILNGDSALNLTMAGWLHGLLSFHALGRDFISLSLHIFEKGAWLGAIGIVYMALGLILLAAGWVGHVAAKVVQAAFSRRLEHLADALAVRFIRQTASLAGALKKIAAFPERGALQSGQAAMMSSFFIASPAKFDGLFRDHPPLEDRIFALEPDWDGLFPIIELSPDLPPALRRLAQTRELSAINKTAQTRHLAEAAEALPDHWTGTLVLGLIFAGDASAGERAADPGAARRLLDDLPPTLRRALNRPDQAPALTAAVLLQNDEAVLAKQLDLIRRLWDEPAADAAAALRPHLTVKNRLPVFSLLAPGLKRFNHLQRARLTRLVQALAAADGRLALFEIAAVQILKKYLEDLRPKAGPSPDERDRLRDDAALTLSFLARLGATNEDQAAAALAASRVQFSHWAPWPLTPREEITATALSQALDRLGRASFRLKQNLILAAVAVALHDHRINQHEYELLRALAAALDIPLPGLAL